MRTDMQARIEAMLDEYRATRSQIEGVAAAAATMTVSVRSPDRSVIVTVDATGGMYDLRIDAAFAARLDAGALSARILGAARLAAAQAREQLRVTMREALPERLRDLVGADGAVDLAAMLPADLAELTADWAYP
jgi:DNA-binding protein YbaB